MMLTWNMQKWMKHKWNVNEVSKVSVSLDIVGEYRARRKSGCRCGRRLALDVEWTMRGKGSSRADDDAELDKRVGGVKWRSTRWWCSETWGATLREVGAEEPTEVTNGMVLLMIDRHVSLTGVAPGGCSEVDGEIDGGVGYRRMALTGQWVARRWCVDNQ